MLPRLTIVLLLAVVGMIGASTETRREGKPSRTRQRHQKNNGNSMNDEAGGTCELEISCKNYDGTMPVKLPIKGPRGPIGSPGEPGEKGDPGEPGMPGIPGDGVDEEDQERSNNGAETDEGNTLLTLLKATIPPNSIFIKDDMSAPTPGPTRTVRYRNLTISIPSHLRVTAKPDEEYDEYIDSLMEMESDGSSVYKAEEREEDTNRIVDNDDDEDTYDNTKEANTKSETDETNPTYTDEDEDENESETKVSIIESSDNSEEDVKGVDATETAKQTDTESKGAAVEEGGAAVEEGGVVEEQTGVAASKGDSGVSCLCPCCSCPLLASSCTVFIYVVNSMLNP